MFADSQIPAGEKAAVAPSDNNNLKDLIIENGTLVPAFSADQTEYVVVSDGLGEAITVTGTAVDADVTVSIDGGGESRVILATVNTMSSPIGSSVNIVVGEEDGSGKTYHVTVYNEYVFAYNPLTGLHVMFGTVILENVIESTRQSNCYAIQVGNQVELMDLRVTASRPSGGLYFGPQVMWQFPAPYGVEGWVNLDVGFNKFEVQANDYGQYVNANFDIQTARYSIIVFREALVLPSDNNDLSALTISKGTISPEFAPGKLTYTATVADDATTITVAGTAADSKAAVSVNGGSASKEIALVDKVTEITIVVTGEDSKVKTYTVRVTKEAKKTSGRAHPLVSERTVGGRTIARFDDLRFGLIVQRDESGLVDYRARIRSKANDVRLQMPYADVMTKSTKGARDLVLSVGGQEIRIPMATFEGDWLAGMPCQTEATFEIHLSVDEAGQMTYTIDFFVIEQIDEKTRLVHRRTVQK